MNSNVDPDAVKARKRFRMPERIKQQNEQIFKRKLDRVLPPAQKKARKEEPEPSAIKFAAVWLALLGLAWLLFRYGIKLPR